MTIEINEFWKLLSQSRLLPEQRIQSLLSEFSSAKHNRSANALAKWLVDQKAISTYQATILLAGHDGPFQYGNYTLVDRFNKGHLRRTFRAVHSRTRYPVMLEFFAGTSSKDLKIWQQCESIAEKASQFEHPNLLSVFESVALDDHRFVVSQLPAGVSLHQTLTPKGRLPWKTACLIAAQVARGLDQLHLHGIAHGSISPNYIWLQKNGFAQIQQNLLFAANPEILKDSNLEEQFGYWPPEWSADLPNSTDGDVFALGSMLYRAITARMPWRSQTPADGKQTERVILTKNDLTASMTKFELPKSLESLLHQLLAIDPGQRPSDLNQLNEQLTKISGNQELIDQFSVPTNHSKAAYRQSLSQFNPGNEQWVEQVPEIETGISSPDATGIRLKDDLKNLATERAEKINAATASSQRRRRNRWKLPATVAVTLLLFAGGIGLWAIMADRKIVQAPPAPATTENESSENEVETPDAIETPEVDLAAMEPADRPILLQELIEEDDESLWESPTTGAPVNFAGIPLAPKLIFVFRPAQFIALPEGQRTLQSLGPEFNSVVEHWESKSGLKLADISQLIVSLHTTPEFEYEPFFLVTTVRPWEVEELVQKWNFPRRSTLENGQSILSATNSNVAYYIFPSGDITEAELAGDQIPTAVSRFAFGSPAAIEEVTDNPQANRLAGSLKKISDWADRDRHLNVLFLRNALFNDEGQQLMGPGLAAMNRELSLIIPDPVRGGLFSLHLNDATFLELMLDRNVDLQGDDVITIFADQLRIQRDRLTQFVAQISPTPYWDKVRQKYDNMLADLFRNIRWDVEHGEVIANCWLPPMAAHNLIAASELVISFSHGDGGSNTLTVDSGPNTIEELLKIKRDLIVANPPDLNVLMSQIESDVNDDHRDMPFQFRIRLLGADLEQKGITKNQRPSALAIEQESLSDILTTIMVTANPSQDITGPADPNCQLIWVIAEDPESAGEKAILVTTRAAAEAKSYQLPAAFRTE